MGQLKPSEVRLLVAFFGTVLILGSFFLYEWYMRELAAVKATALIRQEQRDSLMTMRAQQDEYNQKRVWLNQHQPLARDEFEAREALDRVVSAAGIEAAGLTLINTPPERPPRLEPYYWAFERRVVVQGEIQNIVQWLASLQSESAFRAVTQLHIYPKKRTEPEILTCELTIEQRYVTEDILNMTNVAVVSQPPAAPMNPVPVTAAQGAGAGREEPSEAEAPSEVEASEEPEETRGVIMPPAGGSKPEITRPRVPPPGPRENQSTGGRVVRRPLPPPPVQEEEIVEEEFVEEEMVEGEMVEEEVVEEYEDAEPEMEMEIEDVEVELPEPVIVPGDAGETESLEETGGEFYDVDTPDAGDPEAGLEADVDVEDYPSDTN